MTHSEKYNRNNMDKDILTLLHILVQFFSLFKDTDDIPTNVKQYLFNEKVGLKLSWSDIEYLLGLVNTLSDEVTKRVNNPELFEDPQFSDEWQQKWKNFIVNDKYKG